MHQAHPCPQQHDSYSTKLDSQVSVYMDLEGGMLACC